MIRMATPVYQLIDNYLPSSIKLMLNRYSSGSNTVKHKSTWNKLLKSMLLDVILYTVLTIFSIIIFFTYVNPIIRIPTIMAGQQVQPGTIGFFDSDKAAPLRKYSNASHSPYI